MRVPVIAALIVVSACAQSPVPPPEKPIPTMQPIPNPPAHTTARPGLPEAETAASVDRLTAATKAFRAAAGHSPINQGAKP